MSSESWFKIAMPAFPVLFTVFGAWFYFGDNPLPLLPPPLAFWGLVILYYLFTHLYVPSRRWPFLLTVFTTLLWFVASLSAHNLGKFLSSKSYTGFPSVLSDKDFWYAYTVALIAVAIGIWNFLRYEPLIVSQVNADRASAAPRTEVR